MGTLEGQVAVITGGASGIGRAFAAELVAGGASVVLADINGELAEQTADELGDRARARTVDVRDAAAVKEVVEETARDYDGIDIMFNNAGIAIFGETLDTSLDDWNRTIDINVKGVVNGIMAAYPKMVEQGSGHILSTASLAGLAPSPALAAYSGAKHAVVGMSTSLRAEACQYGVKVSAVCPGLIRTPLIENAEMRKLDRHSLLGAMPFKFATAQYCARKIVRGMRKNKPVIVVTGHARLIHGAYRVFPGLVHWVARREMKKARAHRTED